MKNVYSLQHLRNSAVYDSKEIALTHISSVTSSDGSIALARYKDGNGVKTLIAVNYNENGVDDPTNLSASYTIFSNDDEAIKAINDKLNALPNEFKTINGESIVGSGDISIDSGVGMVDETSASGTGEIFNSYSGNGKNIASGAYSHAEGSGTTASGSCSHAEGNGTTASGRYSHAEGVFTNASKEGSHAEGVSTTASDYYSHAEGCMTTASGPYGFHAEGYMTTASGQYGSHAEGYMTTASGDYGSHTEGRGTKARGAYSHSEGYNTTASGDSSHAEGNHTTASGNSSHAEGDKTTASGECSHAEGYGTTASAYAQHAMGRYNTSASSESSSSYIATNRAFIIGNGGSDSLRGDAFYVLFNGETHADGAYSNDGADYAEMFEWEDGNASKEDRVGYFVTLQNDKIKVADSRSGYILGIVSSTPMVIGDNPLRWYGKYLNDEWGRPIYETIEYEEEVPLEPTDDGYDASAEESQTKKVKRSAYVRKINPDWKNEDEYILRTKRDEWACIGLLGKLLVRQDGTLVQGGFCKVGDGGIATMSDNGYYVMKVNSDTQALILFR